MNEKEQVLYSLISKVYYDSIKPLIIEEESYCYVPDPVFQIKRNRVIGELLKTLIQSGIEKDRNIIEKFIRFLLINQNKDGSWDEIHPYYHHPSALITAIIGDTLLLALDNDLAPEKIRDAVDKAIEFVLLQEKKPGFFLKSMKYTADHLNVDATCGAFLAHYGQHTDDDVCIRASKRASDHIIYSQWSNGVYPYTVDKGNYTYIKQVPCMHYQSVTLYYLLKIHTINRYEELKKSLLAGGRYLAGMQGEDGRFDWSQSGLLFSYYLTGAYAFALASFEYLSGYDKVFNKHGENCFTILQNLQRSLFVRWEQDTWSSFPRSVFTSIQTAKNVNVNMKQYLFRFLYALYRQIARRRYAEKIDDTLFNGIIHLLNMNVSTIEAYANYPDLFMTCEILDCLSSINIEKE
jgi:hypothetical protein